MDKVVHFEIPARDLERAKKFYATVFGWKTLNGQNKPYSVVYTAETNAQGEVQEAGAINGTLRERDKSVPSPVISIQVNSLDESMREIENAGGKIITTKSVVGDAICSYCRDTEGNVIGLVEPKKG